ncbi:MAG: hypothetical protein R3E95_03475 [Thiolinea sp.]
MPAGFFELSGPNELHTLMPNPTLVHLPGRREPRLFVSILLHGNETTGFFAVQKLLQKYREQDQPLPRALSIFSAMSRRPDTACGAWRPAGLQPHLAGH